MYGWVKDALQHYVMLAERISRYTSFESFFYITLQHLLNPKEKGYEKKI